ncbi:hypothetical protein BTO02_26600 [Paraburkholderia sp. SOS3]|nr:hypothetical protein BTO02_26600 [Paraburkholderia sp. SOS3]
MKRPVRIQNGQVIVAVRQRGFCTKRATFSEIALCGFLRISGFRMAGHHCALIQRHYALQYPARRDKGHARRMNQTNQLRIQE